jgi:hypothetical protein
LGEIFGIEIQEVMRWPVAGFENDPLRSLVDMGWPGMDISDDNWRIGPGRRIVASGRKMKSLRVIRIRCKAPNKWYQRSP